MCRVCVCVSVCVCDVLLGVRLRDNLLLNMKQNVFGQYVLIGLDESL